MITLSPTDKFIVSLTLPDGETNKGVKAFIFNESGNDITPAPIILTHISNGLYMNADTTLTMPVGSYIVQAVVYSDDTYATLDDDYGTAHEEYVVSASDHTSIADSITAIYEAIQLLKEADLEVQFTDV